MKFNQISDEFPIENKDNVYWKITGVILLTIILIWIQQKFQFSELILVLIFLIWGFLPQRIRKKFPDWVNEKDIIGEIEFRKEVINTNKFKTKFEYNQIKEIYFRYNFIKGKQTSAGDVFHNGLAELTLITKNGKSEILKFVIETEQQFEFLKNIFKKFYNKGIEIKEEFTNEKIKTICLEVIGIKSYSEIQELKSEIKKKPSANKTYGGHS